MKMHVLTAAVLAALASQVVMAASEGGDTWSELQPAHQWAYSPPQSAQRTDPVDPDLGAAFEGSEGGDTWSSVQALRDAGEQATQLGSTGKSIEYAGLPGGSEGGDTWSSVAPALQSGPMSSTGLAAATTPEQR